MLGAALLLVAFTVAWVVGRQLYPALGAARYRGGPGHRPAGARQSVRYVATAIVPTAIAAVVAIRTGRAEDVPCRASSTTAGWRCCRLFTVAIRRPGRLRHRRRRRRSDRLDAGPRSARMTTKLTLVLAVPYLLRFAIQLPLFLAGQVVWLSGQGGAGLAAADRRPGRHRPDAVQGPNPIEESVLSDAAEEVGGEATSD